MARLGPALIFWALSLIFLGLFVAMVFEGWAVYSQNTTISELSARSIQAHPHVALFSAFVFGAVCGLLIVHFTKWASIP